MRKLREHPHGLDLGPLKPCLPDRLFTTDKHINLAPEECMADMRQLAKKLLIDKAATTTPEFKLRLIGRRDPRTCNSWLHNSYRMVKGKNRCLALVNPRDAEACDISDGDLITVRSRAGAINIHAAISDEMMPGVISIPHGWGHDMDDIELGVASAHAGVNTNILTDDQFLDTISGNAALNGVPVTLSKASDRLPTARYLAPEQS